MTITAVARRRALPGSAARWVWSNKVIVLAAIFVGVVGLGPYFAPFPPLETSGDILHPPNASHLMGTDTLGRDVLSRVLSGGRLLLAMSLAAGTGAVLVGAAIGLVSGYRGGLLDAVLMRSVDVLLSLPPMLVVLILAGLLPRNNMLIIGLTAVLLSPGAARIIRGLTQQIASRDFVAASEAAGEKTTWILLREILPSVRGRLTVELALRTAFAILVISSLNFLGVGISPPTPDWGLVVSEERFALQIAPWATLFPALAIFLAIATTNKVADWLDKKWK